jgi:LAGLIDADG DNA endonuclease family
MCPLILVNYPINLYKNTYKSSNKNQQRYYYINNIRGINRIGPHNEEVLSVIIGSLIGDSYAINKSGEGVRFFYRQSIQHKEYLF